MGQTLTFTISAPAGAELGKAGKARQRRAVQRAVDTLQGLVNRLSPEELDTIAAQVEQALEPTGASGLQADLVAALTDGSEYSQQERAALELATLLRSFRRRRELLAGSLTAPQVAQLLGTSRQTPHDRFRSGSLLAVLDRGALRFPAWQFDPAGPDGVIAGLPDVLRALQVSPLAKASWFVRPNPYLEGNTPLEALKRGEVERVVGIAQAVGVS
jgi:hypothetical protein